MRRPYPLLAVVLLFQVFLLVLGSCQVLQDGCTELDAVSVLCGDDDDDIDDDDSSQTDDDDSASADDDDTSPDPVTAVTFAAALQGTVGPESAEGSELTFLSGTFQFFYWGNLEKQRLVCRQRFQIEATAAFGQAEFDPCSGCGGQITFMSANRSEPDGEGDDCGDLDPETDLSFLLDQEDIAVPADFRQLSLISAESLVEADWPLSLGGLPMLDVISSYETAGFKPYWVAYVEDGGWMGQEARLADVAAPWKAEPSLLPMFVLYRNSTEPNQSWDMVGDCFLSTLWTVRVGAGMGASELP